MRTTAIFGPPGTGKTTHLVNLISDITDPDLAVVSFSKAAAQELASRPMKVQPAFIGTIHSYCFDQLQLDRGQVVSDLDRFLDIVGAGAFAGVDEVTQAIQIGQFALRRQVSLDEAYDVWSGQLMVSYSYTATIWDTYQKWKDHNGLMDFDDMLSHAVGKLRRFSTVIVDEAQDLSKLQWQVVLSMVKPDGVLIVAGDDDQAIFSWAGADPHGMRNHADETVVLAQSHRVPRRVYRLAIQTVQQIANRQHKKYSPTKVEGYVRHVGEYSLRTVPVVPHTVLCRDRYVVKEVERQLIDEAVPYRIDGAHGPGLFIGRKGKVARAIADRDIDTLRSLTRTLTPYGKAIVEAGRVPALSQAVELSDEEISYFGRIEDLDVMPQVRISTIHAQKGKEYDHVVVMCQCSPRVESMQELQADHEDEIRVWYTALTRARKGVTLIGTNPYTHI